MYKINYGIFDEYFKKIITFEGLKNELSSIYSFDNNCFITALKDSIVQKNSEHVDYLIYSMFVLEDIINIQNNHDYLDVFNKLLLEKWHNKHEDIVMLIQRINNFESVEFLFKAVYLKPDYLSWDDNYSFEKKCIHAIARIGKQDSIKYLSVLCDDANPIIKECSEKQLSRLKEV